jgi:argininosuccinate lyase
MPFRDAHGLAGRIVAQAAAEKLPLSELPLVAMQAIEPRISKDVYGVLSVDSSVRSRISYGGTAPRNVRRQARGWLQKLKKEKRPADILRASTNRQA